MEYVIDKDFVGSCDVVYILENVIYDKVVDKIIITISKPVIYHYSREAMPYELVMEQYKYLLNTSLYFLEDITNVSDKVTFARRDWRKIIQASNSGDMEDIDIEETDSYDTDIEFAKLKNDDNALTEETQSVASYFKKCFPELKEIPVYDGYLTKKEEKYFQVISVE